MRACPWCSLYQQCDVQRRIALSYWRLPHSLTAQQVRHYQSTFFTRSHLGSATVGRRDCSALQRQSRCATSVMPYDAAGLVQPHPNAACILVSPSGQHLTQAFQRAQVCYLQLQDCKLWSSAVDTLTESKWQEQH